MKIINGLEHLICEKRLRELGPFGSEKGKLRVSLNNVYKYWLLGDSKEDTARLFLLVPNGRSGDKGQKRKSRKFHLNVF